MHVFVWCFIYTNHSYTPCTLVQYLNYFVLLVRQVFLYAVQNHSSQHEEVTNHHEPPGKSTGNLEQCFNVPFGALLWFCNRLLRGNFSRHIIFYFLKDWKSIVYISSCLFYLCNFLCSKDSTLSGLYLGICFTMEQ